MTPPKGSQAARRERGGGDRQRVQLTGEQRAALDQAVDDMLPSIAAVVPEHVKPTQYLAIVKGMLAKDDLLALAGVTNTPSLLAALAESARLGLIPGDGYALTAFRDQQDDGSYRLGVVGMAEYTGQLDLIYRTNLVRTVVAEVVFEKDHYVPGKHPHDPPEFARAGGRFGKDRGEPEGAFGYAVFHDGTTSTVITMDAEEILLHREHAKTKKIWDGDFWRSMWLKTIIHELYKWLQKSTQHITGQLAARAALAAYGPADPAEDPERRIPGGEPVRIPGPPPSASRAIGNGNPPPAQQQAARPAGQRRASVSSQREGGQPPNGNMAEIARLFDSWGLPGADRERYAVAILGTDTPAIRAGELTGEQAATLATTLAEIAAEATETEHALLLLDARAEAWAKETAGGAGGTTE